LYFNTHTHYPEPFGIQNIIFGKENALLSHPTEALFSVGVHPWYIFENINWAEFEAMAEQKNVVAIGECGLDKAIKTDINLQKSVFIAQIRIAERLQKPVIVHCVKAYNEVLSIIKQEKPQIPLILHGFNKNLSVAKMFFDYDVYFSFGTNILKENTDGVLLKTIFAQSKLLLETDAQPTSISDIYSRAAELIGIKDEQLQKELMRLIKLIGLVKA
jgi:TatD DNase family protein